MLNWVESALLAIDILTVLLISGGAGLIGAIWYSIAKKPE